MASTVTKAKKRITVSEVVNRLEESFMHMNVEEFNKEFYTGLSGNDITYSTYDAVLENIQGLVYADTDMGRLVRNLHKEHGYRVKDILTLQVLCVSDSLYIVIE